MSVMTPEEVADRWRVSGGERVGSVKKGLAAAGRRAGLGHVTPHQLRRTAAIWMLEAGVPMQEVSQYLGHRDIAITARTYAMYTPDYLRNASKALEVCNGPSRRTPRT